MQWYLKDMYITLKEILLVLRTFLICKFLNFTPSSLKKISFPKFVYNFSCEKVSFSLIHTTHKAIHSCWRTLLPVKVTLKQTLKNNDYWIFLIFFVFTLVFFLELETGEGGIVHRVHLDIQAAAGHKLTAIWTRVLILNFKFSTTLS